VASSALAAPPDVAAYVDGDHERLAELLPLFVEEWPARIEAIQRAIERADATTLRPAAHAAKGALKVLGAPEAAAFTERLEALGHDGCVEGAAELAAGLADHAEALLAAARSRMVMLGARRDGVVNPAGESRP
jgi:HPt (histidine-containing phosphotransfer) domain-containing protein